MGGITGGIFGGLDAVADGRDFWTGSYKTYKLELNQIASADGSMMFEQYSSPEEFTVANTGLNRVYYKPEEGVYGIKDYIEPGKYIKKPVDGIATSKYTDMVFKIPDGGRVTVLLGGMLDL